MNRVIKIVMLFSAFLAGLISVSVWANKDNDKIAAWLNGGVWHYYNVKNGDTWTNIFEIYSIDTKDRKLLIKKFKNDNLLKLKINQKIAIMLKNHKVISLYTKKNDLNFIVTKQNNEFQISKEKQKFITQTRHTNFIIKDSLYKSAIKNNIPISLISSLTKALDTKVDFKREVRSGDKVYLTYDETISSSVNKYKLIDAKYCHQHFCYRAISFNNEKNIEGFYDQHGHSLDRFFDRVPLKKYRISSNFSKNRWHPVLNKWRSHLGIDLAAASGSKIYATGDGKIIFSGRKGGYGKVVIIKHGNKYKSIYAHMMKIAKHSKTGVYVKRGDVIGFVGSTGVATGPHCHYEFRINNRAVNPLTVKFPVHKKLSAKEMKKFNHRIDFLNAWMK